MPQAVHFSKIKFIHISAVVHKKHFCQMPTIRMFLEHLHLWNGTPWSRPLRICSKQTGTDRPLYQYPCIIQH